MSPELTLSPTPTSHSEILPSVIVDESAGMAMEAVLISMATFATVLPCTTGWPSARMCAPGALNEYAAASGNHAASTDIVLGVSEIELDQGGFKKLHLH